jgi:hypothetical protein
VSLGLSDVTKTETTGSGSDTTPGKRLHSAITAQLMTSCSAVGAEYRTMPVAVKHASTHYCTTRSTSCTHSHIQNLPIDAQGMKLFDYVAGCALPPACRNTTWAVQQASGQQRGQEACG